MFCTQLKILHFLGKSYASHALGNISIITPALELRLVPMLL
jgi:hypothetical protein